MTSHRKQSGRRLLPALYLAVLAAGAGQNLVLAANPAGPGIKVATGPQAGPDRPKRADFKRKSASAEARHVAHWVVDSADNRGMPFVIVDKADATVYVFDAGGHLRGSAPALLGMANGDDAVPGIGERELSGILPEERTTPAGRFVASLGRNMHGQDILWVDYGMAISLHRVVTSKRVERRAERLATPTPFDNRISYGCINVPVKFFEKMVSPAFKKTSGIVYVLPETRTAREVFASYDVDERGQAGTAPILVGAKAGPASQP